MGSAGVIQDRAGDFSAALAAMAGAAFIAALIAVLLTDRLAQRRGNRSRNGERGQGRLSFWSRPQSAIACLPGMRV